MIKALTVGRLQEHTYFFIDEKTKHGFLIDPGDEAGRILKVIADEQLTIEKIILTHGHFDHIGAVEEIRKALHCLVVIHEAGRQYLSDAAWNLSAVFDEGYTLEADQYVQHGDIITLDAADAAMALRVIHAPGHTEDGVAFYSEAQQTAFVGDIIFRGSIGRSDHPGGSTNRLLESIKAQIFTLPDETVLYPGHGPSTTVKHEKATNPYFNLYE